MRYNDSVVNWQRCRLRQHLGIKRGDGSHLTYMGLLEVESEALYDVFLHTNVEQQSAETGLPIFYMIDISGLSIRYATPDETRFIMNNKLVKRHTGSETDKL